MAVTYDKTMETMEMECDYCGEMIELEGTKEDCIYDARQTGWKFTKDGDERVATCQQCFADRGEDW